MTDTMIIMVGMGVVVTLTLLWGIMREKRRDAAMALAAAELGMIYVRDGRDLAGQPFTRFSLFQEGRRRRFKNHLQGQVGGAPPSPDDDDLPRRSPATAAAPATATGSIEVHLFDYRCVTGSHRHHHTHQTTVAAFHVAGADLPELSLQPEGLLDKIGGLLGYQDIDFTESPGFSGRYLLRGPQEEAIRRLFTPEVLAYFDEHPGWCVEAGGEWVVVFRRERRVFAEDLKVFLAEAFEVCTMLAIHF